MNKSTIHETFEAAQAACTGKSKVFKIVLGDRTFWVVSHNQVRAGHAALVAAEGTVELAAKAPKRLCAVEILAAITALSEDERKELQPHLKTMVKAK